MSENLPMASKTGWGDLDPVIVRETLREDVTSIVKEVLSDKEVMKVFWGSAIEAFQERAAVSTGKFALGAIVVCCARACCGLRWVLASTTLVGWAR